MNRLIRIVLALLGLGLAVVYWFAVSTGVIAYSGCDGMAVVSDSCSPVQLRITAALLIAASLVFGLGVRLWRRLDRAVRRLRF